jgi:hypothetical protein
MVHAIHAPRALAGVAERFGGQKELELVVPTPSVIHPDEDGLLAAATKLAWKEDDEKGAAN